MDKWSEQVLDYYKYLCGAKLKTRSFGYCFMNLEL